MHAVWFITGTSSGLGKALAEAVLNQENTLVYGIGRRHVIAHERYLPLQLDLSDTHALSSFSFPQMQATQLVLCNNAGRLGEMQYTGKLQAGDIISTYTVNAIAPHILSNQFIAQYQSAEAKKIIINITSGAAQHAYDGWSMYGASKAAIDMFTRSIQAEQQQNGAAFPILCFAIAPGVMDTGMQSQIRNTEISAFSRKQKFVELYQNHQLYHPDKVAAWFVHFAATCDANQETVQRVQL